MYNSSANCKVQDLSLIHISSVNITFPEQKRNLIYIFLESMEMTYADKENGGAFKQNVIPELTQLAQENEDFSGKSSKLNGGYSMPGTTWTMGAMFGQTSGLPLNISIDGNSMDTQDSFFPGITTLGDILQNEGYSQTLLIGSEATFGGDVYKRQLWGWLWLLLSFHLRLWWCLQRYCCLHIHWQRP